MNKLKNNYTNNNDNNENHESYDSIIHGEISNLPVNKGSEFISIEPEERSCKYTPANNDNRIIDNKVYNK